MNKYFYRFSVQTMVILSLVVASLFLTTPQVVAKQPISWAATPALPSGTYAWVEGLCSFTSGTESDRCCRYTDLPVANKSGAGIQQYRFFQR